MADEFEKTNLENHILELNKLVVFRYRDQKMTPVQKMSYKFCGWYTDSIGDALWDTNQKLTVILDELASQNKALYEKLEAALTRTAEYKKTVDVLVENVRNLNNERLSLIERLNTVKDMLEEKSVPAEKFEEFSQWVIGCVDEHNARFDTIDKRLDENNSRFDTHDKRLDENNKRFDTIDKRLDENNLRFDTHDKRLDENNKRFDTIDKRLDENNLRFDTHDKRLDENNKRFDTIDKRLDENNLRFDEHDRRLDLLFSRIDANALADANSFSQSGEDMICEYVLKFLRTDISRVNYLDLGANHAKELSNTYKFYKMGGRGVLVEANPELIPELTENRKGDVILNNVIVPSDEAFKGSTDFYVLSGDGLSTLDYESAVKACEVNPEITIKQKYSVNTVTVSEILDRYFKDGMDILNIDLEGIEYQILKEFDFSKIRPKIILLENIEYKPYLVTEKSFSQDAAELLKSNNYVEYAFTGINSIFLDKNFADRINEQIRNEITQKGEK